MIIQKIKWWLWNQMFQYAYVKALSLKNKTNFKIDISEFKTYFRPFELEVFNIEKQYTNKKYLPLYENLSSRNKYINIILKKIQLILKRFNKYHYIEKQFNFDSNFSNIKAWYIEWYFQTEKYFINFEKEIRKDFEFIIKSSKQNLDAMKIIKECNSVSIHIRRWDYVTNKKANNFHWTCDLDYYRKAIDLVTLKIESPTFFLFSDDIQWVKENLKLKNKSYYIDWNNVNTNYEDMRLMSLCQHNIIANSSFSWWWAWLNKNKNKIVIAPTKRVNNYNLNTSDIIPDKWLKI